MVKIEYVGKKVKYVGKTVWEIVGNLKDYGVGRLMTRTMFDRYPEPSFYKILQVEAYHNCKKTIYNPCDHRKTICWVEKVFRGRRYPKIQELLQVTDKPDFRLIPKSEEEIWYKRFEESKPRERILDNIVDLPPLLKIILENEQKKLGNPNTNLKLELHVNRFRENVARPAEKGEMPTVKCESGFGTPVEKSRKLYDNINEVKDYFLDPKRKPYSMRRRLKWELTDDY